MIRSPLYVRAFLLAAIPFALACGSAPKTVPASSFIGCYTLEYAKWGASRIIGAPIGPVPAPAAVVLTQDAPDKFVTLGVTGAFAAKVLVEPNDTRFVPVYWIPLAGDSASVVVPFSVGLYGLGLVVHQLGDSLVGIAETYTDVVGATQASSRVVAHRSSCPRGA